MVQPIDWLAIGAPLAVALTAITVLLLDAFLPERRRELLSVVGCAGLVVALLLLLPLRGERRAVFCVPTDPTPACSYVVDGITLVFQLIAAGGALVVLLLSTRTTRGGGLPTGEYHFLILASATGAMTIAGARDLLTLVVALELVTLPAIAVVGLRRGFAGIASAEAALKFFLVSVVSVAVMLFGIALVYGVTGAVHVDRIAHALRGDGVPTGAAAVGITLTLVGLGFKVGAVPFHFWVPDTYSGAPVPVAAYLSVVSKAAGIVGLLVVVSKAFVGYASIWAPMLAILAVASMTVGNLVALRQRDAVRLLAWSSIAHAGYLLVPLAATTAQADEVFSATMAYLLIYAVVNLGAFGVVAVLAREGTSIERFRGLFWSNRVLACLLAFFLLALAGLPPGLVGLFGKVVLFRAAVDGGAGWLAVVMAVNVVIGLAYYLPWAAALFAPAPAEHATVVRQTASWPAGLALGLTGGLGLVLSVAPNLALWLYGFTG